MPYYRYRIFCVTQTSESSTFVTAILEALVAARKTSLFTPRTFENKDRHLLIS